MLLQIRSAKMELNFKKTSLIFIGAESGKTRGKNKQQLSFASEFPAQCRLGRFNFTKYRLFTLCIW